MLPIFRSANPSHRHDEVKRQVSATRHYSGGGEWEEGLAKCMMGDLDVPRELAVAFGIFMSSAKKERIEALLLAGAEPRDIEACLGVARPISAVYHRLFFDTSVFQSRLDRIEYAESYPSDILDGKAKTWKRQGVEEGLEYLKALFGGGNYSVSPSDMIQQTINKSFLLLGSVNVSTIDSDASREIRQWALTGVKGISQMPTASDMSGQQNSEDIIFKLDRKRRELESSREPKSKVNPGEILTGVTEETEDAQ